MEAEGKNHGSSDLQRFLKKERREEEDDDDEEDEEEMEMEMEMQMQIFREEGRCLTVRSAQNWNLFCVKCPSVADRKSVV